MSEAAVRVDGRRERTKRTRAAIVLALTEILDEGRIEPTAAEIAERAKVAVRSIAQHFATREELLLAVASHHSDRLAHAPIDARASFEERVVAFTSARAKELEASRAMRGAAAVMIARSPAVARALHDVAKARRLESSRVFDREIKASRDAEATERALALVTSGRAWDASRADMGLTTKAARELLEQVVRKTLA